MPLLTSYRTENHAENFLAGFCTSLAPDKPQLIALALALVESDNSYVQSEVRVISPPISSSFKFQDAYDGDMFNYATSLPSHALRHTLIRTLLFFVVVILG